MAKSWEEINARIASGEAVVFTAEEFAALAAEEGLAKAAKRVDVVTTGTFGPMCSSGAFFNFGHSDPPIKMGTITLNDVPASGGLAAVDTYLGVTEPSLTKGIEYGGAHVIEDLLRGKAVRLKATGPGHRLLSQDRDRHVDNARRPQPGVFLQSAQRLPELRGGGELERSGPLHVPRHAPTEIRQCDLLLGRRALAAPERPHLPHHRCGNEGLCGGRGRVRRLAGHAAQPQPDARRTRGAGGAERHDRGDRRS